MNERTGGVAFCAASRLALGNFQRVTNVARALAARYPDLPRRLLTNSERGAGWARQSTIYDTVTVADRTAMAASLRSQPPGVVVVSTIVVPGLDTVDSSLCLILREVLPGKLSGFRLANGRAWDLVIVPNPPEEWLPDADALGARRVEAVGWIYRRPGNGMPAPDAAFVQEAAGRRILVATGGGSGDDEHDALTAALASLIAKLRATLDLPLDVVQARGPNARANWSIPGVDRTIEPGPALHDFFARADLVISTAGYNSVLELACTDVPVLLMPIGRYSDDQHKRAHVWGPRLGHCFDPADQDGAVRWMAAVAGERRRRSPVDLGPSGAPASATLIRELLA